MSDAVVLDEREYDRWESELAECASEAEYAAASLAVDEAAEGAGLAPSGAERETAIELVLEAGVELRYEELNDDTFAPAHEFNLPAPQALFRARSLRPLLRSSAARSRYIIRRRGGRSGRAQRRVTRRRARAPGRSAKAKPHPAPVGARPRASAACHWIREPVPVREGQAYRG